MIYSKRNYDNVNKLAKNTRQKALNLLLYAEIHDIEVLVYETIRSVETQRENVRKGASQTMRSYHIVGQALDFVPVDKQGNALWNGYNNAQIKKFIAYAKEQGFEWGGDWKS